MVIIVYICAFSFPKMFHSLKVYSITFTMSLVTIQTDKAEFIGPSDKTEDPK